MEFTDEDRKRFNDTLSKLIGNAQEATDAAKAELAKTNDISHHVALKATSAVGEVTGFTRAFDVVGIEVPGELAGRVATLAEDWNGVIIRRGR